MIPETEPDKNIMVERVGRDAALLSITEIGLGSLLHSLHVPLTGQFLSLNQGLILSRATKHLAPTAGSRRAGAYISNIAALLKSLAPAGKKLTPMLAISAQGLLFSLGVFLFGPNVFGIVVGMILLSVWAFLQPVLIYYLIFGRTIVDVAVYYLEKLQEFVPVTMNNLVWILGVMMAVKATMAVCIGLLAVWLPDSKVEQYFDHITNLSRKKMLGKRIPINRIVQTPQGKWASAKSAAGDLCRPLFVVSLALTFFFFVFSESSAATIIWGLLRPIAAGFLLFYLVRTVNFDRVFNKLDQTSFAGVSKSMSKALEIVKGL